MSLGGDVPAPQKTLCPCLRYNGQLASQTGSEEDLTNLSSDTVMVRLVVGRAADYESPYLLGAVHGVFTLWVGYFIRFHGSYFTIGCLTFEHICSAFFIPLSLQGGFEQT